MKLGIFRFFSFVIIFFSLGIFQLYAEDKIVSVPLINLEDLLPTFEEGKDELEKIENKNVNVIENSNVSNEKKIGKKNKVYINLTALDKITAKTSSIQLAVGEKKYFGQLEIKALKCELSENDDFLDTVAYLQVKDLSNKDNNQVFLFNGWTFVSSPTLRPIDHPVYDLWITSCENI